MRTVQLLKVEAVGGLRWGPRSVAYQMVITSVSIIVQKCPEPKQKKEGSSMFKHAQALFQRFTVVEWVLSDPQFYFPNLFRHEGDEGVVLLGLNLLGRTSCFATLWNPQGHATCCVRGCRAVRICAWDFATSSEISGLSGLRLHTFWITKSQSLRTMCGAYSAVAHHFPLKQNRNCNSLINKAIENEFILSVSIEDFFTAYSHCWKDGCGRHGRKGT